MSKLPLDLSKFKKTECDDNFTTLKHDNGHIIKVCHGGLTGKLKSDLDKMPLHKAKGGMIKGYSGQSGDSADQEVTSDDSSSQSPQAPVTINLGMPGAQQPVAPSGIPNALSAPGQMGTNQTTGVPDALSPDASQTAPPAAQAGQPQITPPSDNTLDGGDDQALNQLTNDFAKEDKTNIQKAALTHLMTQDAAMKMDSQAGHIAPKDYAQIFNKEDTPAKIGTLFGLIVGGLGSGLTGQPNVALQMMDKVIQNDMNAQTKNVEFDQNLKRINNERLTAMSGANLTNEQADVIHNANKYMIANRGAFDGLVSQYNNLPDGSPAKEKARLVLASLAPMVDEKNFNIASVGAAKAALMGQLTQSPGAATNPQQRQKQLMLMGPQGEKMLDFESKRSVHGIPEVEGQTALKDINENDQNQLNAHQILDQKGRDLLSYAGAHEGTWNPSTRSTAAQKAEEMINYYNSTLGGGGLTEGRLAWLDEQIKKNPTSIIAQELYGNQARLQEIVSSNLNRRNQKLTSLGFNVKGSGQSGSDSGIVYKQGIGYRKQGNYMVPVK